MDVRRFASLLANALSLAFVKIVWHDLWELTVVWIALFIFHFLPILMPVPGWAGAVIEFIHQLGSVAVATLLVCFLILDVYAAHQKK